MAYAREGMCMDAAAVNILAAVSGLRLAPAMEEYALHEAIASALKHRQIPYVHEARLAPRCRIDFLCGGVGIEVKRGKPVRSTLLSQLSRYCACEQISTLILVVERTAHLPKTCCGKPVYVISLNRLWGVSLP